jgi:6-phosphogluconolactonase
MAPYLSRRVLLTALSIATLACSGGGGAGGHPPATPRAADAAPAMGGQPPVPGAPADGPSSAIDAESAAPTPDSAPAVAILDGGAEAAPPAATGPGPTVYVGGFRAEIDVFRLDMATAKLTKVAMVANPPTMPSFFAWHASGKFGYSVDEVDDGKVVAYGIDQTTGLLTRLNDAPVMGFGPTYVALDRTGKWALTASWADTNPASIAVSPVGDDGKVGPPADRRMFPAGGHAHFITTDPTNKYVFASINGENYVAQYRFDAATGKLTENSPARVMRSGGPRHMDFHPNGKFAYLINEQGNTVTVYGFDAATGLLSQLQDISTLPAGFNGTNSTAHILVHRSGSFVYGSNRGHDSIVIYGVDQATGMLKLIGFQTGVGPSPRNFAIDPTGTLMLVAGQNNGMLSIYKIDQAAGTLSRVGTPVAVGARPTYVGVLNVGGR